MQIRNNPLQAIEVATVLILAALVFSTTDPLLEEYGLLNAFNAAGLSYLQQSLPLVIMRPLHLIPSAIQWIIDNGSGIGAGATGAILLILRYLIARWAARPILSGNALWVFSTLSAALISWPGVWLGRFHAAQLATIFFLIALGCIIRLSKKASPTIVALGSASIVMMLMTYQSLAICLLAVPIAAFVWNRDNRAIASEENTLKVDQIAITSLPIIIGFVTYAAYVLIVSDIQSKESYEVSITSGASSIFSIQGITLHLKQAFVTAYTINTFTLPFFLIIAFYLHFMNPPIMTKRTRIRIEILIIFAAILILPSLASIYLSNLHIRDVDRVMHPVSVGFTIICLAILARHQQSRNNQITLTSVPIIITTIILSFLTAEQFKHYSKLQKDTIQGILAEIVERDVTQVILHDTTGLLGDVYTLLNPTLTDALNFYGSSVSAVICTPKSIDRVHPVALRYPIQSTPRCESQSPQQEKVTLLTAYLENGKIKIK